jgi:hypothetical protein
MRAWNGNTPLLFCVTPKAVAFQDKILKRVGACKTLTPTLSQGRGSKDLLIEL